MLAPAEETQLVTAARAGSFDAFERLVSEHEPRLFALARHMVGPHEAADVLQTSLLGALEALPAFRSEARFGTWLTRILTNAALKLLRTRRNRPTVPLDPRQDDDDDEVQRPEVVVDWRDDPARSVERGELRRLLDEAAQALPEHHRLVFVLRDVAGLSVAETAKALEISPANVKVRLLRARLALRERLGREFGDERRRLPAHHHADAGGEGAP